MDRDKAPTTDAHRPRPTRPAPASDGGRIAASASSLRELSVSWPLFLFEEAKPQLAPPPLPICLCVSNTGAERLAHLKQGGQAGGDERATKHDWA
jgi:hypothetical protein